MEARSSSHEAEASRVHGDGPVAVLHARVGASDR